MINWKKLKHGLKAFCVVLAGLFLIGVVSFLADEEIMPGWDEILFTPVISLNNPVALDHAATSAINRDSIPKIQKIAKAPVIKPPDQPVRMSGQAVDTPARKVVESSPSREVTNLNRAEVLIHKAKNVLDITPSTEHKTQKMTEPTTIQTVDSAPSETESQDQEPVLTPEQASRKLAEVISTGGELVEKGLKVPGLVARWDLKTLEFLVDNHYGEVVADLDGRYYQILSPSRGTFMDADNFLVFTNKAKDRISNRGIPLNKANLKQRMQFYPLEKRFLENTGQSGRPIFYFFASGSFDLYLRSKQMGAMVDLGLDLRDPEVHRGSPYTVGSIRLNGGQPAYVIDKVCIGRESFPWRDPEALILNS